MESHFQELICLNQEVETIPNKLNRLELSALIAQGISFYWRNDRVMTQMIINSIKYHITKTLNERKTI